MNSKFARWLREEQATLATAESLTGGQLAAFITKTPGASDYYLGGIIAYQDEIKIKELKVAAKLIQSHTAVSGEVAEAMAIGARKRFGADYAISTTGVAGPGSAYGQPAGTVWVAIAGPDFTQSLKLALKPDIRGLAARAQIQNLTVTSAIAAFERILCA